MEPPADESAAIASRILTGSLRHDQPGRRGMAWATGGRGRDLDHAERLAVRLRFRAQHLRLGFGEPEPPLQHRGIGRRRLAGTEFTEPGGHGAKVIEACGTGRHSSRGVARGAMGREPPAPMALSGPRQGNLPA